jgi:hypothetical protein
VAPVLVLVLRIVRDEAMSGGQRGELLADVVCGVPRQVQQE